MGKKEELKKIVNLPGQKKEGTFGRYHDPDHPRYERYHKRFPLILSEVVGPKILDAGCGTGLTCFLTSQRDDIEEIHGVDLQESVLAEAKNNVKSNKVIFHHGFVEDMNFEDNYFNTVVLGETIEHVTSVYETLSEAHRVLKPGGRVVITCPYRGQTSQLHVRSVTRKFLKKRVEKYFKIEKFEVIEYPGPGPKGLFCVGVKLWV
jgi:2-polyprenyl-6-hydroxyphenyl methylase/3-demethylubiquinone-9 3-methyltransferase